MRSKLWFIVGAVLVITGNSHAYNSKTHTKISEAAANSSRLADLLYNLQLTQFSKLAVASIARPENDGSVIGWIKEGAIREDGDSNCDPRVRNHFYNPLNNAGYFRGTVQGPPSVEWGLEDVGDESGQDFSYKDAKEYFWQALTATTDDLHQRNLALTFRSLGQVIHLIQDAAQPQHTRNDSHAGLTCPYTLGLLGPKSLYEEYVETVADQISYTGYPTAALVQPHHYWDDESGNGIAEFSNANFVTAGTNFRGSPTNLLPHPDFPRPDGSGAQIVKTNVQTLLPGTSLSGTMTFVGTPWTDVFAGTSGFNPYTSSYSIFDPDLQRRMLYATFTLNRFNFDAAQSILIPRAVGYSAGLIDFFFRGRLEIGAPHRFAYMIAPYADESGVPGSGSFKKLELLVRNVTEGAETGPGTIQAIVRYRPEPYVDPFVYPGFTIGGPVTYAVSKPQDFTPSRDDLPLTFDFSENPIPIRLTDLSITVAFRGPLVGANYTEDDAIVFGGKDVFEPQLIDFGNASDYDCFSSTLYDVVGRDPSQRDLDGDSIRDLYGPSVSTPVYARIQENGWGPPPTQEDAHFIAPMQSWAEHNRYVYVQDRTWYRFVMASPDVVDTSTGAHTTNLSSPQLVRALNHFIDEDGKTIHEIGGYDGVWFRGDDSPVHLYMVNQAVANNATCRNAMPSAPRTVTEVPGSINEQP